MKNTEKNGSKRPARKALEKKESGDRYIPEKFEPQKLADYLEVMTMAVFQAGVSWALIHKKWDAFKSQFANFEPELVARFGEEEVARLLDEKSGIVRSEKKIRGTIKNAQILLELDKKYGGFRNYLRSHESYQELSSDIRKRFKYVGELSVYYLLFRTGENVPLFQEWVVTIEGDHPRMKEMVEKYS
jgi:3-methyladenine DNA glycosylase Tag